MENSGMYGNIYGSNRILYIPYDEIYQRVLDKSMDFIHETIETCRNLGWKIAITSDSFRDVGVIEENHLEYEFLQKHGVDFDYLCDKEVEVL